MMQRTVMCLLEKLENRLFITEIMDHIFQNFWAHTVVFLMEGLDQTEVLIIGVNLVVQPPKSNVTCFSQR